MTADACELRRVSRGSHFPSTILSLSKFRYALRQARTYSPPLSLT